MKKICPYCHHGKLTVSNTYTYEEFKVAYSKLDAGLQNVRKDYNPRACYYRRYYCDGCDQYIWSYEEVFHKVPKRPVGITPKEPKMIDVYKDGEYRGTEPKPLITNRSFLQQDINRMTGSMTEEELQNILNFMRNR